MQPDHPQTTLDERRTDDHDGQHHVPTGSAPETGRNVTVFIVVLAIALCGGFWWRHHRMAAADMELADQSAEAAETAAPVDVVRVGYAAATADLDLPGETAALHQSTIYARVSGYIGKWSADIGDKVHEGQVLAEILTPELDDQYHSAEAKVTLDKSLVAVAQANEAFAKSSDRRWATSPPGIVPEQQQDEKKADYLSATARLKAAQSQVDLDQAEVNSLADLRSFKLVRAPFDGVITSRRIDIGDLVTAGSTAGNTHLYDIAQSDKIRVFVDVPQAASSEIVDRMPAVATAQQFAGRRFNGTVTRTSESIDPQSRTLKVEVDIDNPDLTLKAGMYLDVSFRTSTAHPPLRIPAGALTFRAGGPQAAVVDSDGTVHFHDVTIARDLGNFVELASGVTEGELVALNISNQISNGDKVRPNLETNTNGPAGSSQPHVALSAPPR